MPQIDMPLEKLKEYKGRNPRPADFDAFWDKSLAELREIDPAPRFIKNDFPAFHFDCYDLYFTSTKGAVIHGRVVCPKHAEGKLPAVLTFHGLSGEGLDFPSLLTYAAQGYVVTSMDARGQGGCSEDVGGHKGTTYTTPFTRGLDGAPEDLLCRDLFLDTAMIARIVMDMDRVDENRVAVLGGSQGGALSVACAALVPKIKLCTVDYPYLSDYQRVWEMDQATGAYEGLRYYFRHRDPRHEREEEIFTKLGYIDIQFLAPRIRAKVQMATGLMDTTCPPSTQFAMYNKLTCEKEFVLYPDYGHESLKGQDNLRFRFIAENL